MCFGSTRHRVASSVLDTCPLVAFPSPPPPLTLVGSANAVLDDIARLRGELHALQTTRTAGRVRVGVQRHDLCLEIVFQAGQAAARGSSIGVQQPAPPVWCLQRLVMANAARTYDRSRLCPREEKGEEFVQQKEKRRDNQNEVRKRRRAKERRKDKEKSQREGRKETKRKRKRKSV